MRTEILEPSEIQTTGGLRIGDHIKFEKSVTINRPPARVYSFWRPELLPLFMTHVVSVMPKGDGVLHWTAQTDGEQIEWDTCLIENKPGELICWQSLPGAALASSGCVRFTPARGGRGTVVRLTVNYVPGGGGVGATFARIFNKRVAAQIAQNLFNFKSLLETGEIPTAQGQPRGGRKQGTDE